ncbi:hypothetical protein [Amycolatopsis sp. cmx-11-32]|uniref:hypothetical protein n=1 Tax=Amycolatopsis sp. cmx-11-32 TaxID=2785796 RepID=UPI0039E6A2CC
MDKRWKRAAFLGAGVLVLLVAGVVTWGVLQDKKADWFSAWASGASSIVAVFALLAAGVAANATIATNRNQSEQLRRLEESNQREQATKFGLWLQLEEPMTASPHAWRHSIYYHNAGSLPVYTVNLTVIFAGETHKILYDTLAPTTTPTRMNRATVSMRDFITRVAEEHHETMHPEDPKRLSEDPAFKTKLSEKVKIRRSVLLQMQGPSLTVDFSDGESRWRRETNGALTPLP